MIIAGHNHMQEINAHVSTAQIILLLISPDFLASEYYSSIQIDGVMARHKVQSACVIPIFPPSIRLAVNSIGRTRDRYQ